ncbi:MAG: hypothetical protein WD711_12985 [Dongiaceae bacterium]
MRYREFLRVFLIGFALVALSSGADAQTYEDGLVAFDRAEYPRAAEIWEPLAAAGNAKAQHALGMLYESGQGVPAQDFARAAELYRGAANQGEAAAMNNLGLMYADGRGVSKDVGEAYRLWMIAAKSGHPMAQFNLALLFFRGAGLPDPDYNEAAWWFAEAANNGSVDAQFALGELYARGMGVPQSDDEARRWYTIAAGSGHGLAQRRLDELATATDSNTTMSVVAPVEVPAEENALEPVVEVETIAEPEPVLEPVAEPEASEPEMAEPEIAEPEIAAEPAEEPTTAGEPIASSDWADPDKATTADDAAATADTATGAAASEAAADTGGTQQSSLPDIPPPGDGATAEGADAAAGVEGVYVLLGRAPTPVQAEQAWSILKVAFPNELGPVSPRMTQSADGKFLILGGPLATEADAKNLCDRLRQRAESVECQIVRN